MATSARKRDFQHSGDHVFTGQDLPSEIVEARGMEWGVTVDAYLLGAARVGQRYAATVFCDLSGVSENWATVATPALVLVKAIGRFKLMRSVSGVDHFVIASEQGV